MNNILMERCKIEFEDLFNATRVRFDDFLRYSVSSPCRIGELEGIKDLGGRVAVVPGNSEDTERVLKRLEEERIPSYVLNGKLPKLEDYVIDLGQIEVVYKK